MLHAQIITTAGKHSLTIIKTGSCNEYCWGITSTHNSRMEAESEAEKVAKWQGEIMEWVKQDAGIGSKITQQTSCIKST